MQECRWLEQFEFVEWTPDAHLRHSRFVALREDKRHGGSAGVVNWKATILKYTAGQTRCARMGDQLPIIPHESLGADCCGCLMVRVGGDLADIVCNECGAVIRTIRVAEVENTLRELARTDAICNARCPHCGIVNTFPGCKMIEAFICSACGRGAAHDTKLH